MNGGVGAQLPPGFLMNQPTVPQHSPPQRIPGPAGMVYPTDRDSRHSDHTGLVSASISGVPEYEQRRLQEEDERRRKQQAAPSSSAGVTTTSSTVSVNHWYYYHTTPLDVCFYMNCSNDSCCKSCFKLIGILFTWPCILLYWIAFFISKGVVFGCNLLGRCCTAVAKCVGDCVGYVCRNTRVRCMWCCIYNDRGLHSCCGCICKGCGLFKSCGGFLFGWVGKCCGSLGGSCSSCLGKFFGVIGGCLGNIGGCVGSVCSKCGGLLTTVFGCLSSIFDKGCGLIGSCCKCIFDMLGKFGSSCWGCVGKIFSGGIGGLCNMCGSCLSAVGGLCGSICSACVKPALELLGKGFSCIGPLCKAICEGAGCILGGFGKCFIEVCGAVCGIVAACLK